MDPIKTDKIFYHNLLIKNIPLLLYISQCFGFLPYPSYVLQQHNEHRHIRTWILSCLNTVLSVLIFCISLVCYLVLYMYYPFFTYKDSFPDVIRIMYHVESWLRGVLVLIALVGPRLSGRYFRETIDTLVDVMQLYDHAGKLQRVCAANSITTKRLLLLYCCHTSVVTVTVWISTEHPVSTLLNMSYIAPYVAITVYTLLYQALLTSVSGIASCLNDTLFEVTLLEKNHPEQPYEKHTTISYIRLHNTTEIQHHHQQVDVATIEKLSTLHMGLMRLVQNGNKQFGVLMVIILLYSFIQTNMLLIELYHNIRHPMLPKYSLWIYFLHALVHFSFFLVIAKPNHSIQQQNERTMLLLHEFKCSWNSEQNMAKTLWFRYRFLVSYWKMAWSNTKPDRLRQQLRRTIGTTVRISQLLSLAPYPLSLFQKDCSTNSVRFRVITFFRYMLGILTTAVTIASQFVLFIYYPYLLYQPKVPIFLVILYYIVNVLQSMTTGNMMIGCERRRSDYEGYFAEVLPLIKETAHQSDCKLTIWYRNLSRALLFLYSIVAFLVPIIMTSITQQIGVIPYVITHTVPFVVSYMILLQYFCVFIHLSSILRKLNERLIPLMNMNSSLESESLRPQKHTVYNILGQSISSSRVENNHLEQIEQLRLLNVRALEIAGSLSGKFGTVIVLIVVAAFASVNIELLELYQSLKLGNLGTSYIILKFMFAAIKFSFYILIAYPNRLIQNENQRTVFMLYRIKRTSCTMETNGAIEHYISQISNLQDIHTACGMINLDMKLIANVVAAITSIMVVLIQFSDTGL